MERRQGLGDIHKGSGLTEQDIEHLRQVYISACFTAIHRTTVNDTDEEPKASFQRCRQRSVPIALNELTTDNQLIKFLESKGKVKSGPTATIQMYQDESQLSPSEDPIDVLTQKLAQQTALENDFTDNQEDMFFTSIRDDLMLKSRPSGKTLRRLDRFDVLTSPRFRKRRNALANILDKVDIKQLQKRFSVPDELICTNSSSLELSIPSAVPQEQSVNKKVSLAF